MVAECFRFVIIVGCARDGAVLSCEYDENMTVKQNTMYTHHFLMLSLQTIYTLQFV